MNKEKTAMQMLIKSMDARLAQESNKTAIHSLKICLMVAKGLLQKEQEQIEKAFDTGYERGGGLLFVDGEPDEGSEYYQSKYVNNGKV